MPVTTVVVPVGDVDRRQRQQRDQAGQDEQNPRDQPARRAVEQPPDVDRELLRFGARQEHAVAECVQEPLLADPAFLIDQSPLHDRNLTGRTAEGLQRNPEPDQGRLAQGNHVYPRPLHLPLGLGGGLSRCHDTRMTERAPPTGRRT
jgi:hypothetical protein